MTNGNEDALTIVEPPKPKPAGRAKGDTRSEQTRRKRERDASENADKQRRARVKAGMALIQERQAKGELAFVHTNVPDTVDELIDRMTNEAAYRPETRVLHGVMDLNGPLADAGVEPMAVTRGDAVETVNGVVKREALAARLTPESSTTEVNAPSAACVMAALPTDAVSPEAVFERALPPLEAMPEKKDKPVSPLALCPPQPSAPVDRVPKRQVLSRLTWWLLVATAAAGWLTAGWLLPPRVAVLDVDRVKTAVIARAKTQSLEATYRALDAFDGVLAAAVAELLRDERLVLLNAATVIGLSAPTSDVTADVTDRVIRRLNAQEAPPTLGATP